MANMPHDMSLTNDVLEVAEGVFDLGVAPMIGLLEGAAHSIPRRRLRRTYLETDHTCARSP
jgi:hypothetical protein